MNKVAHEYKVFRAKHGESANVNDELTKLAADGWRVHSFQTVPTHSPSVNILGWWEVYLLERDVTTSIDIGQGESVTVDTKFVMAPDMHIGHQHYLTYSGMDPGKDEDVTKLVVLDNVGRTVVELDLSKQPVDSVNALLEELGTYRKLRDRTYNVQQ